MKISDNVIERRIQAVEAVRRRSKERQRVIDELDVKPHIARVYHELHDDIARGNHEFINLPGGRGSGKSSFCALEIVNGIMQDQTGESSAIVFRRTANTMRESVYSQIAWAIDVLDVGDLWRGSVSPMCWTYKPTGAQIIFRGLDLASKLKSIKPRRGYFRFIWLEEFSELPGENFTRSVMQSVQRGGSRYTVFRSFNPPINASNWANVFIARPDPRAITLHTTYLDVPAQWVGDDFILEAERLQEINEQAYRHEYLGEATGSGGEVFPNVEAREITDAEIEQMQYFYCGVDWGFSVDPFAFIRCSYDRRTQTVYILDEIVKRGCSNTEIADMIKAKGYDKAAPAEYYTSPLGGDIYQTKQLIICDSAEPKSIADLRKQGIKAKECKKYPGSVNYGIRWLQSKRIIIDPRRTPHAFKEFTEYEYEQTKDGEFLASVPDKANHLIDSTRYSLDMLINNAQYSA